MNNLLSYCGLVDAKIRASDIDLPVQVFLEGRKKMKSPSFLSKRISLELFFPNVCDKTY